MKILKLSVENDIVWQLTLDALKASLGVKPLTIRCRRGCKLAQVGSSTDAGLLFTSSWDVERDLPFSITVNGREQPRREALAYHDAQKESQSGPPIDYVDIEGVLGLLHLPSDLPQEYPDLMVRCEHGDAVLDRIEVVGWIREGRAPKIATTLPRLQYVIPRYDGGERQHSSARFRIKGDPMTIEEAEKWLATLRKTTSSQG